MDTHENKPGRRKKQEQFLEAFRIGGNITKAADISGISRSFHYMWMQEEGSDYPSKFADAQEEAADALESEARRRAVDGVDEPVGWYQGEAGGVVRRYSDTLLIFLLKGARPKKYRERHEHDIGAEVAEKAKLIRSALEEMDRIESGKNED